MYGKTMAEECRKMRPRESGHKNFTVWSHGILWSRVSRGAVNRCLEKAGIRLEKVRWQGCRFGAKCKGQRHENQSIPQSSHLMDWAAPQKTLADHVGVRLHS